MSIFRSILLPLCLFSSVQMWCQQVSSPEPQAGSIIGTVTDTSEDAIPGATVVLQGPDTSDSVTSQTNQDGFFTLHAVRPAVPYHVKVSSKGFGDWVSPEITLKPGQDFDLAEIKLMIAVVETTVSAVSQEEVATEQVKAEEKQRILGIVPNFYVAYDPNTVPLTTKLKYKLAIRTATDVFSFGAAAFLAGVNQAADNTAYVQGAKGYGQRFGAAYADGATDILLGGAILPSLLHQDPRYFYQGTGTTKSRVMHALSSPFWCKGDNGKWGFNYSSVGGDLISGALSNIYYPPSDRGPGLVFMNAAITTAGRMASGMAQEFVLKKFTSHSSDKNQD